MRAAAFNACESITLGRTKNGAMRRASMATGAGKGSVSILTSGLKRAWETVKFSADCAVAAGAKKTVAQTQAKAQVHRSSGANAPNCGFVIHSSLNL
jgi:hypothetical protein